MSTEEQLALLSAGTRGYRSACASRVRELAEQADWSALERDLRGARLLPTLGPRLLDDVGTRASADFDAAVRRSIESGRRQDALLELVTRRLLAALTGAGVRASALKGPRLGEAIYGEAGRRPSSDIDLLVPEEQLPAAVAVVREFGYLAPTDHLDARGLPLLHLALAHRRSELPPVELHWRVHWYERDFARERLLPASEDPSGDWRPRPVDELVALLLFYARDGLLGLRLATDLGAWWDAYGASVDAAQLELLLRRYPALDRPVRVAACVSEQMVGLPAIEILAATEIRGIRARVALRLADPHPHSSAAQRYAEMGLIDWLLAPTGGLGELIRRQVLVPRVVRLERARRAGKRRAVSSAGHAARVLGRYGMALARLAVARR